MPNEWRISTLIPIYKNKEDIKNFTNYHEIKFMSHALKLWKRVIEHTLRYKTTILENQFGFMAGQSAIEVIFLLRHLMEKYRGL